MSDGFWSQWGGRAAKYETEKRRREVLTYLSRLPDNSASADIIRNHCHRVGIPTNRDEIDAALVWLSEQNLLRLRDSDGTIVAQLTADGQEIGEGQVNYPGIHRVTRSD